MIPLIVVFGAAAVVLSILAVGVYRDLRGAPAPKYRRGASK